MTPLTATRPPVIRSSAARREATPAWARIFCSRSPVDGAALPRLTAGRGAAAGGAGGRIGAAEGGFSARGGRGGRSRRTRGGATRASPDGGRGGRVGRGGPPGGPERG